MAEPLEPEVLVDDEQVRVGHRRYLEAIEAGLSVAEAMIFADNGEDIGTLRKLVADGCPANLIALIVV